MRATTIEKPPPTDVNNAVNDMLAFVLVNSHNSRRTPPPQQQQQQSAFALAAK